MFRRVSIRLIVCALIALVLGFSTLPTQSKQRLASQRKPNVVFIAVDDLRPLIGTYGAPVIQTLNIDRLARRGTTFMRAYCQQAVCSPSRTSLLTGRRPDTTKVYDLQTHFRRTIPDVVTLPQHFKQNGYHTQSFGKIYHGGLDDEASWSVPSYSSGIPKEAHQRQAPSKLNQEESVDLIEDDLTVDETLAALPPQAVKVSYASGTAQRQQPIQRGPAWAAPDVPDNALGDGQVADKAIEAMQQVKDNAFFLAVGFRKPHLSFVAPKKYYDLYPLEQMQLATASVTMEIKSGETSTA